MTVKETTPREEPVKIPKRVPPKQPQIEPTQPQPVEVPHKVGVT
jgi:hypothetical protein